MLPSVVFAANSVSPQSPLHGTTVVNNNAGGWVPYMDWTDSLPGSAFIYYIEISTQSRVNSLGHFWDSDRVGNATLNSPITYWNVANEIPPFYLLPGTYYWHVLRWDNYVNSSWSNIWSFTVPAVAPIANAKLGAMPSSFTFEANQGDTGWLAVPYQTLTTLNLGGSPYGQMYVSTNTNNPSWLDRGLGALPGQVYVYVKPDGLSGGTYNGSLTLKGVYADGVTLYPNCQNQNLNIPVTLKINRVPVLSTIGPKTIEEGKELLIDANAPDLDGESIIYTATGLPAGATIHPGTGVFKWTPSGIQAGSYWVTFKASDGKASDTETVFITVNNDATPPTTPTLSTPVISTNQSPTRGFDVSWNATDLASGIFGFQLRYKSNTATGWSIFKVGGTSWYANKKIRFPGTAGKTYDFKVLAKDNDGNVSTSAIKKTVVPLNQSVFAFSGWSSASSAKRYMGNAKYSTAEDSSASYNFSNVKEILLILTFRPNGGKVDVFFGNTKIKTIDTYRSAIEYRVAVRIRTFSTAKSGKIKAVNTHTKNASSSNYRVELDGIALRK